MKKNRKAWWIVACAATAFALFVFAIILINYNSTDAQIERAVAQIVEEHGFEFQGVSPGHIIERRGKFVVATYSRESLDADMARDVASILHESCSGFECYHPVIDEGEISIEWSDVAYVHNIVQLDRDGGVIVEILFYPNIQEFERPDGDAISLLRVTATEQPGQWERIKRIWPW